MAPLGEAMVGGWCGFLERIRKRSRADSSLEEVKDSGRGMYGMSINTALTALQMVFFAESLRRRSFVARTKEIRS